MAFKSKHNIAWHIVIIDDVIVGAGCDFNVMIQRQDREKAERKGYSECKMVTYYARSKKQAVYCCMDDMEVRNLSKSLQAEFNSQVSIDANRSFSCGG